MTIAAANRVDPFRLFPDATVFHRFVDGAAGRLLGASALSALYAEAATVDASSFEARALATLGIDVICDGQEVPRTGPLIVAANHPRGMSDGLVLVHALRHIRPDLKLVVNHLLARIPELRERCFFVDPFGGPEAAARSRAGLRQAHLWLRQGGAIGIFPSGMVAPQPPGTGVTHDGPWHATVGRLALATRAAVVPAVIHGRNSDAFYRFGRIHPVLRTLMLGRELLRQRGTTVRLSVGAPLRVGDPGPAADPRAETERIREAVEILAAERTRFVDPWPPVVDPVDPASLQAEIHRLRPLVSVGELDVFCEEAGSIPALLREIGRLREVTFRDVGEGTGRPVDLDAFDESYLHLFAWSRTTGEVVGAYRIACTDRVLASQGVRGLYTSTLFRYDERLMHRLSPALELGRSFVRREYQRHPAALLALWKGIGQLVARNPRYRTLFGPVSISSRYRDTSQQMLIEFLTQNHRDAELAELVEALNPPSLAPLPGRATGSVADVDALIARAEPDGKGMPVLLRQYLRLNARVIGFNVDPAFGDALDALVTVDLADVDPAILGRYLGKAGAATFARSQPRAA